MVAIRDKSRTIAKNVDMYRRVPTDLMEGTKRGSILSYLALISMFGLFLFETRDYFQQRYVMGGWFC